MNRSLAGAVVALIVAAPWVLWSRVPAPTLELWYLAAHANERRSVWIAILVVAGGLALRVLRRSRVRRLGGRPLDDRGHGNRGPGDLRLGAQRSEARRTDDRRSGARVVRRCVATAVLLLASLGVSIAAFDELRSVRFAAQHDAPLSVGRYAFDWARDPGSPRATMPYARVEGRELLVDVWDARVDPTAGRPLPAIVRVHGGSWAFGTRSESPHWCRVLVDAGFVVLDVDYRLAPPPRWSDAVRDVRGAVVWARAHADELGIDAERIALMGASAGGHLALSAAYADDGIFAPTRPHDSDAATSTSTPANGVDEPDASVRAVVAISPPVVLDIGFDAHYPWWYPDDLRSTRRVEDLIGGTPSSHPERFRLASPIEHVDASSPATLLVHGARDRLVWPANSERLAARLEEAGVQHRLLALPGSDHLFEYAAGGLATQIAEHAVLEFLDATLRDPRPNAAREAPTE